MGSYYAVAVVTLVFGLVLFGMSLVVSRLRITTGTPAPATKGNPKFERAFRAHMNTVEWTPIYLPAMWIFAVYWSNLWAAIIGSVWIIGRVIYFAGYVNNPEGRFIGMSIQAAAAFALVFGALGRIVYLAVSA